MGKDAEAIAETEKIKEILSAFRAGIEEKDSDFNYYAQLDAERQICRLLKERVIAIIRSKSSVFNSYGDRLIKAEDWREIVGVDFEGQPIKKRREVSA